MVIRSRSLSHPYFSICIFYLFIFFLLLLCVCIYSYEQDDADASFSQDSEDLTEKRKKREIRLDIGEGNSWNVVMPFAPHTHGALAGNEEIRTRVCVCDVISNKGYIRKMTIAIRKSHVK